MTQLVRARVVCLCVCVRLPERTEEVCWFNGGDRKCQAPLISSQSPLSLPLPHLCPPPASLTHPHVQMHRLHAGDELWAFCGDEVMLDYPERNQNDERAVFCRGFALVN